LRDPAERVGVGECALELGVDDRIGVLRLAPSGVADGLLALGVRPAGAVGDDLSVVADEQPAEYLPEGVQLGFLGLDQAGADLVPEVTSGRLGVAGASLGATVLVFGGVAKLVVVDPRAGEVGLLAGGRGIAVFELLVDEIEHERGSTTPMPAAVPQLASAVLIPILRHADGAPQRRDRRLAESLARRRSR
jgi:hypothetical protein